MPLEMNKEYLQKKYELISGTVPCGMVENLKHEGKLEMLRELMRECQE